MRSSKRITALAMAALFTLGMASTAFAGTWSAGNGENQNKWCYDNGDGTYANNGWQWIDGNNDGVAECYYFDENGWLLTNTVTPDGFNVNADGAWIFNGQIQTKITQLTASDRTSDIDGRYMCVGYFYDDEFFSVTPQEADMGLEYMELSEIDEKTLKAVIWGRDIGGSEITLKKDGDTYKFESGKLSDRDIYSDLYSNGEALQQYIYELHMEDGTLVVSGANSTWDGIMTHWHKDERNRAIFKK